VSRLFAAGFTAGLLACALGACGAGVPEQHRATAAEAKAIADEAARGCKDDPSEKAAHLAREKYPDSLLWPNPPKWRFPDLWGARATFLRENRWAFFDFNHDGRIDFEGYHAWIWAGFLAGATAGKCIVTRNEYFYSVLGKPGEPLNGWSTPMTKLNVETILYDYNMIDLDGKGFITKKDAEGVDRFSFERADTMHRGYLTPDQRF
jgi:hypothetical protein